MHSNLECIKYDINMGVSRKNFPEKKSKCLNPRWILSKGRVRATSLLRAYSKKLKKNWKGGGCNRLFSRA